MEGSEVDPDGDTRDPGLAEAPTGAPPPSEDETEDVNEAHPNEGEIEEAVEDTDLTDSPEDVTADDPEDSGEAHN